MDTSSSTLLQRAQSIWMVGIKGTGMVALAQIFSRLGKNITGSDVEQMFFTQPVLDGLGITAHSFGAKNITRKIDLLIYSTAYKPDHPEIIAAQSMGIPCLSYPEALGLFMQQKKTIAVTGTHGKTTVTALLGFILQQADFDPTVLVGAPVPQFDGSAIVGGSDTFVVEADEYQDKFTQYHPTSMIVNNIEYDHPDFFPDPLTYFKTFVAFAHRIPSYGFIIANVNDTKVQELITQVNAEIITFGTVPSAQWTISSDDEYQGTLAQGFVVSHQGNLWAHGQTNLVGQHNMLNVLATIATAVRLNIPQEKIIKSIQRFRPPRRRFEFKGTTTAGTIIIDDFAHHPGELQPTITALRQQYPDKRLIGVFDPHTFTRTKVLFDQFAQSFRGLDSIYLMDIFGSAREEQGGVSSEELTTAINAVSKNAHYVPTHDAVVAQLNESVGPSDVVITLGAGKAYLVGEALLHNEA